MPQDGSNNYQYPPGTPGIPDTTIESEAYNTFLDDLVLNDLNIPRPVHRGGTGASTADAALVNLKAEKAEQVVTAYLSHVWMPGSFRSAIGATDAPVAGHAFAGICYINEPLVSPPTNANVTVEARDQSDTVVPGKKYIRQKIAGVWGAWAYEDQDVIDYAAPFDALAYSGMQINSGMSVAQELTNRSTTGYICDGWVMTGVGMTSMLSVVDAAGPIPGIPNRVYMTAAVKPALAAGDILSLLQSIEGYRIARLGWGTANAQPITIGFWVNHSLAGTYSVAVRNSAKDRSYTTTYTQNVVNAQEYKTVTIPGCTDGTWFLDNRSGMDISFAMLAGTSYTAPTANVWNTGNYLAAPGQVNALAATGNYLVLRGVTVLPGIQAPTAAQSPMLMRPYDQELTLCQRHYWRLNGNGIYLATLQAYGPTGAYGPLGRHPVPMRTAPTMTAPGGFNLSSASSTLLTVTSMTTGAIVGTIDGCYFSGITVASGLVAGDATILTCANTGGAIVADARL